jgi:hypothetical protein
MITGLLESDDDLIQQIKSALQESPLVRAIHSIKNDHGITLALTNTKVRYLESKEITRLECQGNYCEDWSRVRVAHGFDWRRIRNNVFQGDIVLGCFTARLPLAAGIEAPTGIYNCTLANCVIGHNALIRDVKLLANYVVGSEAVVWDCGTIVCEGETTFGAGLPLSLGLEAGGRELPIYAEITVAVADALTRGQSRRQARAAYQQLIAAHVDRVRSVRGVIGPKVTIRRTNRIRNTFVGQGARIEEAALIEECTLLSNPEEPIQIRSSAVVTNSVLQWGARADTSALVDRSVLTEHSYVEHGGKVTGSLLGPNTGVASGEVTASLVGPLVGFRHQALIIATLWPAGKGNVGAGAYVGCNHTSRAPDQEFWCAEGLFIGLGVKIVFPADFSGSPYSILACGVTMHSQRLAFPFSLVTPPSARWAEIPQSYNEVIPAWMLTDNLFAVKRNEAKFSARNKATRLPVQCEVFHAETVDQMRDACRRLDAIRMVRDVYTERDIEGLGKNYLTETNRQRALAAYRFHIHHYALIGLLQQAEETLDGDRAAEIRRLLVSPSRQARWEHQRRMLCDEPGSHDVVALLCELDNMLHVVARDVERSRTKDDLRGRQIIADYAGIHVPADEDPLVQHTWKECRQLQERLHRVLLRIEAQENLPPISQAPASYAAANR